MVSLREPIATARPGGTSAPVQPISPKDFINRVQMLANVLSEYGTFYFTNERLPIIDGQKNTKVSRGRAMYPRFKPFGDQRFSIVQNHALGIDIKHHFLQFQRRHNIPEHSTAQQIVRHTV